MIAISHLLEVKYKPWMVGTAQQIGGKGYPTSDLRITKPPPGQMMAQQRKQEALGNLQTAQAVLDLRKKKNLTPAERAAGMA